MEYKIVANIELNKSECNLDNNIDKIIDSFLKYLNYNDVNIYNEDSLKYELGIYLKLLFPNYYIDFERNTKYFGINTNSKHEIDITIYPKKKTKIIDPATAYAIELKYPSYKIEIDKNNYSIINNKGINNELKQLETDLDFVTEIAKKFKNAWSIVLVSNVSKYIYEWPNKISHPQDIYYKFRMVSEKIKYKGLKNPYKLNWKSWKDINNNEIGKYYIKSGKEIKR